MDSSSASSASRFGVPLQVALQQVADIANSEELRQDSTDGQNVQTSRRVFERQLELTMLNFSGSGFNKYKLQRFRTKTVLRCKVRRHADSPTMVGQAVCQFWSVFFCNCFSSKEHT